MIGTIITSDLPMINTYFHHLAPLRLSCPWVNLNIPVLLFFLLLIWRCDLSVCQGNSVNQSPTDDLVEEGMSKNVLNCQIFSLSALKFLVGLSPVKKRTTCHHANRLMQISCKSSESPRDNLLSKISAEFSWVIAKDLLRLGLSPSLRNAPWRDVKVNSFVNVSNFLNNSWNASKRMRGKRQWQRIHLGNLPKARYWKHEFGSVPQPRYLECTSVCMGN